MDREPEVTEMGTQLGSAAVQQIVERVEEYCEHERQRIALVNEARIIALNLEGTRLAKVERQMEERLRLAPPSGNRRSIRGRALVSWMIGIMLSIAAFFFSLVAFAPYRLGWKSDLYCLGIALVTPFAMEEFLTAWKSERLFKAIVSALLIAALIGGALLAAIRGDLLAQQVQTSAPTIVIDGESPATAPPPQDSFYDSTRTSLRLLMLLLALAIDLGAGIAIHRALLLDEQSSTDSNQISQELAVVRERLAVIVAEITTLTNEPAIFVARFWRDFYRAMLTQTVRKAAGSLLGLALCLLLLTGRAYGQDRLNLVVALDLTASESVKDPDQQTQFSRNIDGVKRLLATVPAGARVTVIGITEDSFSQPYILLSAEFSDDQGYFGERLAAARLQLVRTWQKRAGQLAPRARRTDVLGALLLASQLFREAPNRRRNALVIYSDMRHINRDLDLETPAIIHIEATLATIDRHKLLADLKGVDVYVVGAASAGRQVQQWESLKRFWVAYFRRAGADVKTYSFLREMSELREGSNKQ